MRFTEFRISKEQQLDELKMSPGSLQGFMQSPAAQGMRAGFEAELCFRNLGLSYGMIKHDYNEDIRATDIQEIVDFFSDDRDGHGLRSHERRNLRNTLESEYWGWASGQLRDRWSNRKFGEYLKWYEENVWDISYEVLQKLKDKFGADEAKEIFSSGSGNPDYDAAVESAREDMESAAQRSWDRKDSDYVRARDEFISDIDGPDQPDEEDWLRAIGIQYMSDVENLFHLTWPYYHGGEDKLYQDIADKLTKKLKVPAKPYEGGGKDEITWYVESDSSIEPDSDDDMGAEITSPPMPLPEAVAMLDKFFAWAEKNGAYANNTTGFHMGISLPGGNEKIDYVKLALFLGDRYVLEQFGRLANNYCKSALEKVKQRANIDPAHVMKLMRSGMMELASQTIHGLTTNKYTSINVHDKYIEFRSAGGADYFQDLGKLKNTMLRYAQAMAVAADPTAYREEYAKKLYALLQPSDDGTDTIKYFSQYSAGQIPAVALQSYVRQAGVQRELSRRDALPPGSVWMWIVTKTGLQGQLELVARSRQEAIDKARQEWGIQVTEPDSAFQARPVRRVDSAETPA